MIIITGASKGIGQFLLNSFVGLNDNDVLGTYLSSKPLEHLDKFVQLNVTEYDKVQEFVNNYTDKLNNLTLINCAGITNNAFAHKCDPEIWKNVIDTNLVGTYNVIRALLPIMRIQKFGRIINFSSVVASKPTPGISSYAASKAALWGMSKSIAIENAALNITINNINLGYSELGMIEMVPEEYIKTIISQIPSGILCPPADILNAVNFLISTRYITGSSIELNGGLV